MDDGSFEDFVAERSTALLGTAYLLTGDRVAARDLLQTALMVAERRWERCAGPEEAAAVTRRELVAAHTGWRRLLRAGDLLSGSPLISGAAGLPGFARRPTDPGPVDEVSAALARLAPNLRAALVLRYGEGLSPAATAELLGRPVEAVTADTARGLDLLGTDGSRLGRWMGQRAQQIDAAPEVVVDEAREGARDRRNHLAGLAALAAFVVLVVLVVALTV